MTGVPATPKDVTELHPSQVSLNLVVGDSISAAFSAHSNLNEARQVSFDGGIGAADQLTMPYLLSQYSPGLEGQSSHARLPRHILKLPDGDYDAKMDHLNFAESQGAAHIGSVDQQWGYLMEQKDNYENFDSRWKVLTYWMFANDVCSECDKPAEESGNVKKWVKRTDEFLTNVTENLSNVYVNLVSMLDLSHIHRIQQSKFGCKVEHELILRECGCIDRGDETELAQLDENVHWMNARFHQFAADWRAKLEAQGRKDIAIVSQDFFEGLGPELDNSFLSKLDCFHPSAKAHQDLAVGLWNSMLCTDDRANACGWTLNAPATCPTNTSYFHTGPDMGLRQTQVTVV